MASTVNHRSAGSSNDNVLEVNNVKLDPALHVSDVRPNPTWIDKWEHRRPQWLHECVAEFYGVFFYCYAGFGATAALFVGNLTNQPFLGGLFNIGFAYAMGITFAITVCAMSSGGHFNPALTVSFAIWRDFSWKKVPLYITSQIMGAFVATWAVYMQYGPYLKELELLLISEGKADTIFSASGPAGIFAVYKNPGVPLLSVLMNEFSVDFFLGMVIWGVLDPSNIFVSTTTGPVLIALAYATVIWGYVPATVATNSARDLGSRLAVITIWGLKAWGGYYPIIAALTSFPATLLAASTYELFLSDSSRVLTRASREVIANTDRHREHKAWKYTLERNRRRQRASSGSGSFFQRGEKPVVVQVEDDRVSV